jgi:hypothetical protein
MRVNVGSPEKLVIKDMATNDQILSALMTATPAQIDTWIDNNVTTIADLRILLKRIVKVMAYLLRKNI